MYYIKTGRYLLPTGLKGGKGLSVPASVSLSVLPSVRPSVCLSVYILYYFIADEAVSSSSLGLLLVGVRALAREPARLRFRGTGLVLQ